MQRRDFLTRLIGAGTAASGGGLLWSGGLATHRLVTERLDLSAPRPALRGLTLAHFSDVHWDPCCDPAQLRLLRHRLEAEPADILCFTGDLYSGAPEQEQRLTELLAALPARLGPQARFACPGNHDLWIETRGGGQDRGTAFRRTLEAAGWTVLINRAIQPAGLPLTVAGLDSSWAGVPAPLGLGQRPDLPLVLLAHEPDPFPAHCLAIPQLILQLSGHTHGGQICLPTPRGPKVLLLPAWGKLYPRGTFHAEGLARRPALHVNRGLGTLSPHLRLACPPELTRITFR